MIIVSQDRLSVVNFNHTISLESNIEDHPKELIAVYENCTDTSLGEFKDDERLKEIIADLVLSYISKAVAYYVPKE